MKQTLGHVWAIYLSALLIALVFLPGLIDSETSIGHLLEHLIMFVAAGVFTYSIERLRHIQKIKAQ